MGLKWNEIDDGLTLLYLLSRKEINLLGVTTSFGNNTIDDVWTASKMLWQMYAFDLPLKKGEGERFQAPTEAAVFLVEQVNLYPGEISILATGPLGNLRAAKELDPEFFNKVKQVVCMGGMIHQPMKMGGRILSELNLSADPEASFAVLNAECPVTVMNAYVCLQAPFLWRHIFRTAKWHKQINTWRNLWHFGFGVHFRTNAFYLWDLLPAVYLTEPELFTENNVNISSTVLDLETGSLVVSDTGSTVNMPDKIVDPKRFYDILFQGWTQFFEKHKPTDG
jgi:inosine-uridine nucleoside N-ribohydrolase